MKLNGNIRQMTPHTTGKTQSLEWVDRVHALWDGWATGGWGDELVLWIHQLKLLLAINVWPGFHATFMGGKAPYEYFKERKKIVWHENVKDVPMGLLLTQFYVFVLSPNSTVKGVKSDERLQRGWMSECFLPLPYPFWNTIFKMGKVSCWRIMYQSDVSTPYYIP